MHRKARLPQRRNFYIVASNVDTACIVHYYGHKNICLIFWLRVTTLISIIRVGSQGVSPVAPNRITACDS